MLNAKTIGSLFTKVGKKAIEKSPVVAIAVSVAATIALPFVTKKCLSNEEQIAEAYLEKKREKVLAAAQKKDPEVCLGDIIEEVDEDSFTKKDKAIIKLKTYWPVMLCEAISIGGSLYGYRSLSKKLAAVAVSPVASTVVGAGSEVAIDQAKKTVKEKLEGPDAEKYVPHVIEGSGIERGKGGMTRFRSGATGRWCTSDVATMTAAYANANDSLSRGDEGVACVSLSDIAYDGIGISRVGIGDTIGFAAGEHIDVKFEHREDDYGEPYMEVIYLTEPCKLW
jgi:hypothetical protein